MGWVWSDELAKTLRESPEFAAHIPRSWVSRPSAFATLDDESPVATVRRLLGMRADTHGEAAETSGAHATASCPCGERTL